MQINKSERSHLDRVFDLVMKSYDVGGIVKRVQYFFTHHEYYEIIKKNTELKNEENINKKLYVMALGPSLKQVDINKIKGDSIVVNRFFRMKEFNPDFVPTYYMMMDDTFTDPERIGDFKLAVETYYDKGTKYFLKSKVNSIEYVKNHDQKGIYFVSDFRGNIHAEKDYDFSKPVPAFQNVVEGAILIGIYMGYKEIVLLGCDFNSFSTPKELHFYNDSGKTKPFSLATELTAYAVVARCHEILNDMAVRNGIKIYNSTKDSLIDAYPFKIEEELYTKG